MKRQVLLKAAALFAFALILFLAPAKSHAQASCPYPINNNTSCMLQITYTIFCNNGSYGNTVSIPPFSNHVIQCWEFPAGCERPNIELNLVTVDGQGLICVAGSSNTVAAGVPTATTAGMFPGTPCDPINIMWGATQCDYNP